MNNPSVVVIVVVVLITFCGLVASAFQKKQPKKQMRRKRPTRHFMKLIEQGFRVYDGYFFHLGDYQGGDHPAKFSVLSKKPMNKKSMQKLMPVSNDYIGVVKNVSANDCKYITFNGSDVHSFDNATGKTEKTNGIYFEQNITRYFTTDK